MVIFSSRKASRALKGPAPGLLPGLEPLLPMSTQDVSVLNAGASPSASHGGTPGSTFEPDLEEHSVDTASSLGDESDVASAEIAPLAASNTARQKGEAAKKARRREQNRRAQRAVRQRYDKKVLEVS